MNVNATGAMGMGQMHGMGQGQGQNGAMKEIMQQLPQEDRQAIREQMQSMDQTQRKDFMSQISELDTTNMSTQELSDTLLSMLSPATTEENSTSEDSLLDFYA